MYDDAIVMQVVGAEDDRGVVKGERKGMRGWRDGEVERKEEGRRGTEGSKEGERETYREGERGRKTEGMGKEGMEGWKGGEGGGR